jgi:NAD(P)-dependent dehydrogenase (short-subunit alcohol dehydrogenase family)
VLEALVIGAGPAGLATSQQLAQRGVNHVVLERGPRAGHTWASLYDGLVLHTGKHLSALPGMPFPPTTPLFPSRDDFLRYLTRYADAFRIPLETGANVVAVERTGEQWTVRTSARREFRARAIVVATGILSNPRRAAMLHADRFDGPMIHSVEYRRPAGSEGQRVLVVGAGNSAGEIAVELARAGAIVTVAVRSGARVVPLRLLGIPIQYIAAPLSRLPRKAQSVIAEVIATAAERIRGAAVLPRPADSNCAGVPLIGFHLVDAVRAGSIALKPGVAEFTRHGARFVDGSESAFDRVILATGYTAALGVLGNLVRTDECGFAARRDRVVSVDQPDLYYVGHNYDVRGGLRNIALDARRVGRIVRRARHRPVAAGV